MWVFDVLGDIHLPASYALDDSSTVEKEGADARARDNRRRASVFPKQDFGLRTWTGRICMAVRLVVLL